ncbi:hypothetical protein [Microcoleus sp.]
MIATYLFAKPGIYLTQAFYSQKLMPKNSRSRSAFGAKAKL